MPIALRIVLVACAVLLFLFVLKKTKKATFQATDAVFWLVSSVALIILAAVPAISYFFADLLHIQSPSNFVFFVVIGILVIRVFISSMEIAALKTKLNTTVQEIALRDKEINGD